VMPFEFVTQRDLEPYQPVEELLEDADFFR
jgi:hypothetical protein